MKVGRRDILDKNGQLIVSLSQMEGDVFERPQIIELLPVTIIDYPFEEQQISELDQADLDLLNDEGVI